MSKKIFELIIELRQKCLASEDRIRSELDITPAEYNAFLVLPPDERMPSSVFSQKMVLSASRASRVIDRLVGRGYAKTEPVPDDRRSLQVSLTRKGASMRKKMFKRMEECEERIVSRMSVGQREDVRNSLELLVQVL